MTIASPQSIAHAMVKAVEAAGFVNPSVEQFGHQGRVGVCVSGDCPCGLGASRFAVLFDEIPSAGSVYLAIKAQAVAHIEVDRAQGRWA